LNKPLRNALSMARLTVGLGWIAYQIVILMHPMLPMGQRFVHLAFALAILILGWIEGKEGTSSHSRFRQWSHGALFFCLLAVCAYFLVSMNRLDARMESVDPIFTADIFFAGLFILVVLESVRRVIGWSLLGVILVFLAFGFVGRMISSWTQLSWLPELFKFSGFTVPEAMENFALTSNGLLGVTTATSVNFVFYFILFGAIYSAIGGGRLFIDIGLKAAGRSVGGAPKAAVLASSLMGSISGSAVANVATTGLFTIPLMRRAGYSAVYAGAVEAIASTGGQLMPPVMGVAAFVMAELMQEPYGKIAVAGLIPALAFYWALFLAVDFRARRMEFRIPAGSADAATPRIRGRLHLLLPPVFLVGLLIAGWSASFAAVGASALCVVMSGVWPSLRKSWTEWREAILQGTRQAAEVAIPIAAIGLIIEVAVQSNLALKFSILLLDFGGVTVLGAMALIVVGCLVMGLGLPTVAAYIIGAVLFVPALIGLGVDELPAHFFVMYYCVLSMVTPPVALASYTAAGLAQANSFSTSVAAFRLGLVGFFIPFAFAFNPALLFQDSLPAILGATTILFIGIAAWVLALEGFWIRVLSRMERAILGVTSAALLLAPVIVDSLIKWTSFPLWVARCVVWAFLVGLLLVMGV